MPPKQNAPRGRPAQFDRRQVMDGVLSVFWSHGFDGASVTELEKATGLSRSSLYGSFGDKTKLFEQAIDHYVNHTAGFVAEALAAPRLEDAIAKFLLGAATFLTDPAHPPGCFVILGALVCGPQSEAAKRALSARRVALEAALRKRFEAACEAGELAVDVDVSELAKYVATLHQGMAVQATTGASATALAAVAHLGMQTLSATFLPNVNQGFAVSPGVS